MNNCICGYGKGDPTFSDHSDICKSFQRGCAQAERRRVYDEIEAEASRRFFLKLGVFVSIVVIWAIARHFYG